MSDLSKNSAKGSSVRLTIASNVAVGPDIKVRAAYVQPSSDTVRVNYDSACSATNGVLLPIAPNLTPMYVENLNQLNFYGTTDDDTVDILYRC